MIMCGQELKFSFDLSFAALESDTHDWPVPNKSMLTRNKKLEVFTPFTAPGHFYKFSCKYSGSQFVCGKISKDLYILRDCKTQIIETACNY